MELFFREGVLVTQPALTPGTHNIKCTVEDLKLQTPEQEDVAVNGTVEIPDVPYLHYKCLQGTGKIKVEQSPLNVEQVEMTEMSLTFIAGYSGTETLVLGNTQEVYHRGENKMEKVYDLGAAGTLESFSLAADGRWFLAIKIAEQVKYYEMQVNGTVTEIGSGTGHILLYAALPYLFVAEEKNLLRYNISEPGKIIPQASNPDPQRPSFYCPLEQPLLSLVAMENVLYASTSKGIYTLQKNGKMELFFACTESVYLGVWQKKFLLASESGKISGLWISGQLAWHASIPSLVRGMGFDGKSNPYLLLMDKKDDVKTYLYKIY